MCKERGLTFQPLIFETSGFLDKSVLDFLSLAETRAADVPNPIPEFTTWAARSFRQRTPYTKETP
jgi:hypothetical protein